MTLEFQRGHPHLQGSTELWRKALHTSFSTLVIASVLLLPLEWTLGWVVVAVGALFLLPFLDDPTLERLERKVPMLDLYRKTRRAHESFPWSALLFLGAVFLLVLLLQVGVPQAYVVAAVGILGFGDAASALVGRAWGSRSIPWNPSKTWEGTLAGALAGFAAASIASRGSFVLQGTSSPPLFPLFLALGAISGALLESLPLREDNFIVPVGSLSVMMGAEIFLRGTL